MFFFAAQSLHTQIDHRTGLANSGKAERPEVWLLISQVVSLFRIDSSLSGICQRRRLHPVAVAEHAALWLVKESHDFNQESHDFNFKELFRITDSHSESAMLCGSSLTICPLCLVQARNSMHIYKFAKANWNTGSFIFFWAVNLWNR